MKDSHSNHILNIVYKSQEIIWRPYRNPHAISSKLCHKVLHKIPTGILQCSLESRIYHNSNLKLLESTQRGALSLILRSLKSTPTVALKAELGILPTDIKLKEFSRMEFLKLKRKDDNNLKDKLIASLRNLKPYSSPLQKLAKQGTRLLSHLTGETNIRVIFRAGMNKPPMKLAKTVSSNSTNYHREIDAILLALKYLLSAQSQFS